jgi:probable phosphoglycerate mutase
VNRLIYVRHGESNGTVARIICGVRSCTGLSDLGRQQSERLRSRWEVAPDIRPDLVLTSAFPRAIETGAVVARAFPGVPVEVEPGFGEHDPGPLCDGMPMAEFDRRFGAGSWELDPFGVTFPGGETLAAFHFRIGSTIRRTMDEHPDRTILVVCHGGVIDIALRQALKTLPTGGFHVMTPNTAITELSLVEPNTWCLHRYADAAHLAGLPESTEATPTPVVRADPA